MSPSIFQPGDVCAGSYLIERLDTSSRAAETYLARRIVARQRVLLTCSRFENAPSGSPLRDSFLTNASNVRAAAVEETPRVLAADVTQGVYWVVHEHFEDAIPIWELLTASSPTSPAHAAFLKSIRLEPLQFYWAIIMALGLRVADILDQFANHGICHGGIDPRRNLVIRSYQNASLLQTGHGHLFGFDSFDQEITARLVQAPERREGHPVTPRTDIYALGVSLRLILEHGAKVYKFEIPREFAARLERLYAKDPSKRPSSWEDVYSSFEGEFDAARARVEELEKGRGASKAAHPSAVETPRSGERPRADERATDTEPAPPLLVPESPTGLHAPPQGRPGCDVLTSEPQREAGLPDVVALTVWLAEKFEQRRNEGQPRPRVPEVEAAEGSEVHGEPPGDVSIHEDARAVEAEATTCSGSGGVDAAPTPRLPTLPCSTAEGAPPRAEASVEIAIPPPPPLTASVIAPLGDSSVKPAALAVPVAKAPPVEPSLPASAPATRGDESTVRRFFHAVLAAAAIFLCLVGVRESLVPAYATPDDSPDIQSARQGFAIGVEGSTEREAAQHPSGDPPRRPVVAGRGGRGRRHSGARNTLDWTASSHTAAPSRRLTEE